MTFSRSSTVPFSASASTRVNLKGMKGVDASSFGTLVDAGALKGTVLDLEKVNYADLSQLREAQALVNISYLDKMSSLMESHKNYYAGSYLLASDLRINMEKLRAWTLQTNQEIAEKSKSYHDLLTER